MKKNNYKTVFDDTISYNFSDIKVDIFRRLDLVQGRIEGLSKEEYNMLFKLWNLGMKVHHIPASKDVGNVVGMPTYDDYCSHFI